MKVTDKAWVFGTELRNPDGLYEIGGEKLPSISTVLDNQPPAYAWATWISDEATRLVTMKQRGQKEVEWSREWDGNECAYVLTGKERDPEELLTNGYLKNHGARMGRRASDRGSITHLLLAHYVGGKPLLQEDVKYWVADRVAEPAPDKGPYTCAESEVLPYVLSLNGWLNRVKADVLQVEKPVYTPGLYAGTWDAMILIDGKLYLMDVKTSANSQRWHAEQLAAQLKAKMFVDQNNEGQRWAPIARKLTPLSLLVQEDSCKPRTVNDIAAAHRSFMYAVKRYHALYAKPMPFATVKDWVTKTSEGKL